MHDQITARICIEYFTIGHPQILAIATESPTAARLCVGIVATWWVGLGLGLLLATAAQLGSRPKKFVRDLARPLVVLVVFTGVLATIAGITGYVVASAGWITLFEPLATRVPSAKHVGFIADLFAHYVSYFAGTLGAVVVIIQTWRSRALKH